MNIVKGMLRPMFCIDINIHIVTGNEKLCKIYFKKVTFQNVLVFLSTFLIDIITPLISSTEVACDVMFVQQVIQ